MARLALERTEIRSPMDGVVLRRFVEPGSKRGRALDDPNSAVIASLFDPVKLQVRVDVPLAEAGRLFVGQPARISTAMLPGQVFTGRVSRIVGEADLQRNTLQAKVEVHGPDPRMRPDVLCRVEFWGGKGGTPRAGRPEAAGRQTLWIPEQALGDPSASEQDVWVVDPVSQRAEQRAVRLGHARRNGYRRVLDGLRPNETVVIQGGERLAPGHRITVQNTEDSP
jgi:RND family efflux transporter MFP subunit